MEVRTFSTEWDFLEESVRFILDVCREKAGVVRIALSGGSTPRPVYEALGAALVESKDVLANGVEFYQVDERYVSADHASSNQRMIQESLGKHLPGQMLKFVSFDTSLPIDECVSVYEKKIQDLPDRKFDLMILGIGPDGHVASLFPGSQTLEEQDRLVAHTTTEVFEVKERLTLTFPVILASKNILVLLNGSGKKEVLEKMENDELQTTHFPAKKLLKHERLTVNFLNL